MRKPGPRPTIDCTHPRVKHEHGTHTAYVADGCRCEPCTAAHADKGRYDKRMKAYGRYIYMQPIGPVKQHIELLRKHGIMPERLAKLIGVSEENVRRIIRAPESGVCHIRTVRKILAVEPDIWSAGDRARIDGTGTRRRLEALIAIGWTRHWLADQIGIGDTTFHRILMGYPVRTGTAKRVMEHYDRMWNKPAPKSRQRKFALKMAAERGYYSPLAWDDDEIDNPKAKPHGEWRAVA